MFRSYRDRAASREKTTGDYQKHRKIHRESSSSASMGGPNVREEKRYDSLSFGPGTDPKGRVIGHLPQMAVGIFKVSAKASPICFHRLLGDQHAFAFQ